jgi:hypothetical protein
MRVIPVLFASGALAIAVVGLGFASRSPMLRGEAKEIVALVESKVLGYQPLP